MAAGKGGGVPATNPCVDGGEDFMIAQFEEEEIIPMFCATCNLHYSEHLNFCRRCGDPLVHSTEEAAVETSCCTRCGARFVRGENFCQQCGFRLNQRTQETVVGACYGCGTPWRSGWLYCKHCGLDRDQAMMAPVSTSVGSISPAAAISSEETGESEKIPCPSCGVGIKPYSRYCEACGRSVAPLSRPFSSPFPPPPTGPTPVSDRTEYVARPTLIDALEPEELEEDGSVVEALEGAGEEEERVASLPEGGEEHAPERRRTVVIPSAAGVGGGYAPASSPISIEAISIEESRERSTRAAWQAFGIISVVVMVLGLVAAWWLMREREASPTASQTDGVAPAVAPTQAAIPSTPAPMPTVEIVAPEGMVLVPGGRFKMGREEGDEYEKPMHEVEIAPFFMDRTEVTNEEYLRFVQATSRPGPSHWANGLYPEGQAQYPVVNVTWEDARAYAAWANKRLPTEAEWEFAARGGDGRVYPWGNEWKNSYANSARGGNGRLAAVGSFPAGASPFGLLDMCGNVWEWTADNLMSYAGNSIELAAGKVIRGGAYDVPKERSTATYRGVVPPEKSYDKTGFRCVRDPQPQ